MATEEKDTESTEAAEQKPKKKLPLGLIAIALQALATLGVSGFIIWSLTNPPKPPVSTVELYERSIASIEDQQSEIRTVNLEEFQVNSKTKGSLKAKIVVEVSNTEIEKIVKDLMPRAKDLITKILSETGRDEFQDIQGKLGIKNHLRNSLNDMILPLIKEGNSGLIREVYFTDLLIN